MAHSIKPDSISLIGFVYGPTTKIMLLATGVSSVTVSMMANNYKTMSMLTWPNVVGDRQVWRLLTSQLVITSSITELISNCYLTYSFLVLERRWGSAKYISFLISSWSLSLSMYYAVYKSNLLLSSIPNIQTVPSGLYGPLFAMLVYYTLDVRQNEEGSRLLNVTYTSKFFVYLLMLQMMISFDRPEKTLISFCGIMAGVLHRVNFLNIQGFSIIPRWLRNGAKKLFTSLGLIDDSNESVSKAVLMGATPEIHDDLVYDYIMKKRRLSTRRVQMFDTPDNNRERIGQGYSEVMNPSFSDMIHSVRRQQQQQQTPSIPPSQSQEVSTPTLNTDGVPEGKVQTLMDMGFEREAVLNALASTGNDVQQATFILISASNN